MVAGTSVSACGLRETAIGVGATLRLCKAKQDLALWPLMTRPEPNLKLPPFVA